MVKGSVFLHEEDDMLDVLQRPRPSGGCEGGRNHGEAVGKHTVRSETCRLREQLDTEEPAILHRLDFFHDSDITLFSAWHVGC